METNHHYCRGSASLKLLILTTLIFVLVILLLPSQDQAIRTRVEQGLHQADLAKNALATACKGSSRKVVSNNAEAGFYFVESIYVADIRLSADCAAGEMDIRVRMQNTGAEQEPEIVWSRLRSDAEAAAGMQPTEPGQNEWRCGLARGEATHVPEDCRTLLKVG